MSYGCNVNLQTPSICIQESHSIGVGSAMRTFPYHVGLFVRPPFSVLVHYDKCATPNPYRVLFVLWYIRKATELTILLIYLLPVRFDTGYALSFYWSVVHVNGAHRGICQKLLASEAKQCLSQRAGLLSTSNFTYASKYREQLPAKFTYRKKITVKFAH